MTRDHTYDTWLSGYEAGYEGCWNSNPYSYQSDYWYAYNDGYQTAIRELEENG